MKQTRIRKNVIEHFLSDSWTNQGLDKMKKECCNSFFLERKMWPVFAGEI